MLDNSDDVISLKQIGVSSISKPCLFFICYDATDQLRLLDKLELESNKINNFTNLFDEKLKTIEK